MIHHCVRVDFKPGLPQDEVEASIAQLRSLVTMECVENVSLGQILEDEVDEARASCVVIVSVRDAEAFGQYMHHPIHLEVMNFLNDGRKDRASTVIDYSDDWDPALPGRLRLIRDEPGSLARAPQPADVAEAR